MGLIGLIMLFVRPTGGHSGPYRIKVEGGKRDGELTTSCKYLLLVGVGNR